MSNIKTDYRTISTKCTQIRKVWFSSPLPLSVPRSPLLGKRVRLPLAWCCCWFSVNVDVVVDADVDVDVGAYAAVDVDSDFDVNVADADVDASLLPMRGRPPSPKL